MYPHLVLVVMQHGISPDWKIHSISWIYDISARSFNSAVLACLFFHLLDDDLVILLSIHLAVPSSPVSACIRRAPFEILGASPPSICG
jgi:hypothetical protein